MIDDALSLSVSLANGTVKRWGPDEADGRDIPGDTTLTDTLPGGHSTLTTSLLRRIDLPHPDEQLFADVHCYGVRGRTAWRGRMQQFPRTHGQGFGVSPGAVGYSAHLRDDPSFQEIYVDRDFGQWQEPPLTRKVTLAGSSISFGDFSWQAGGGALVAALPNQALGAQTIGEVWYTMPPGLLVSGLMYVGAATGTLTGWQERFVATDSETGSPSDLYPWNFNAALQTATLSTSRRYVHTQIYSNGTATTPSAGTNRRISTLAVYGGHGLTRRAVSGDADGFYGSDVVADVVARAAPMLTYTTGVGGSIEPTEYVIGQLAYRTPTTAEDVIADVNKYHQYDWGVYDNRQFFFRYPDPYRLLWEARLSDGAHLDADGDTAEQMYNGVFVTYTDPTGIQKTVGPPGGNFDDTDSLLEDTSSSNPVNAAGIPRKWAQLNLSFPALLSDAVQIGYVYLRERSLAGRRGRVTLTGSATHPTEGKVPAWRPRAGDWISLKDLNGSTVPRKIIEKNYTHSSRQCVLTLDNTAAALDAIMARVGVQVINRTGGF